MQGVAGDDVGSVGVDERLQRCCVAPTQPDKLEVSRFTL